MFTVFVQVYILVFACRLQVHYKEVYNISSGYYFISLKKLFYFNVVFVKFIGYT